MKILVLLLFLTAPAWAAGRLSPPLSVEGAKAALAQAGVHVGSPFQIGPYRYRLRSATPASRGNNRFTVDITIDSLPMEGQ